MRHFWCQVCDGPLTNERTGIFYLANQKPAWVRQMLVSVTHTKLSRYLAWLTDQPGPQCPRQEEFVSWYIMTTHQSATVFPALFYLLLQHTLRWIFEKNDIHSAELTFISLPLSLSQCCFVQFLSWEVHLWNISEFLVVVFSEFWHIWVIAAN